MKRFIDAVVLVVLVMVVAFFLNSMALYVLPRQGDTGKFLVGLVSVVVGGLVVAWWSFRCRSNPPEE